MADENVAAAFIATWRRAGGDILTLEDLGLRGSADSRVLESAAELNRPLITLDHDFGRMIMAERFAATGVLLLRAPLMTSAAHEEVIALVANEPVPDATFLATVDRSDERFRMRVRNVADHDPD